MKVYSGTDPTVIPKLKLAEDYEITCSEIELEDTGRCPRRTVVQGFPRIYNARFDVATHSRYWSRYA